MGSKASMPCLEASSVHWSARVASTLSLALKSASSHPRLGHQGGEVRRYNLSHPFKIVTMLLKDPHRAMSIVDALGTNKMAV